MTVGGKKLVVKFKNLQGQVIPVEVEKESTISGVKKALAKKMNDDEKGANAKKIHAAQLRLTHKNTDLGDDEVIGEVTDVEDDFVLVFVGDASKVPINVKFHVFKGTGVEQTSLDVNLGDNADTLKDKLIAASFGPQDKSYTLFFKGRPLLAKKSISEYGVEDGSEILVGVIM